jgi:hypothetical protein
MLLLGESLSPRVGDLIATALARRPIATARDESRQDLPPDDLEPLRRLTPPAGLIATPAVPTKKGWLGQILVDGVPST